MTAASVATTIGLWSRSFPAVAHQLGRQRITPGRPGQVHLRSRAQSKLSQDPWLERGLTTQAKRTWVAVAAVITVGALPAPANAATITPDTFLDDNTNNDNCTLREAIIAANTDTADDSCTAGTGADEIPLQAGTYELGVPGMDEDDAASGDLDITDPDGLKITGDPDESTVDGNTIDRVFHTRAGATVTFDPLTITGGNLDIPGSGAPGGGIFVAEASMANVVDTTFTGNHAIGEGAAIDVSGAGSTLNLTGSTVAGNTSDQEGGGIEYGNNTTVNVTNTTISGNTAAAAGGAIEIEGGVGNFMNVTITTNSAPSAGGIVLTQADGTINLKGTILAGNTALTGPECATPTVTPITSQGHNLIGNTSGCTFLLQGTDILGLDPLLGPLADNGGPTLTHALQQESPAIDAGPPDAPPTDQRGAPRNPDIGAYELVTCVGAVVNRIGTAADDDLTGTEGADGFLLLAGNDTASGLGGADAFCAAEGNDAMTGGGGDDAGEGSAGNDSMQGDAGNDSFDGGEGDDSGGGGEGDDTALGLTGNDSWAGDAGNDAYDGGDGNDTATGGDGNDSLEGLSGKDRLKGQNGKDRLKGGNGRDRLNGGKGRDRLNGGKSKDTCKGAAGKDKGKGCEKEKQIP
jgi:CSLREA domain-containing protein